MVEIINGTKVKEAMAVAAAVVDVAMLNVTIVAKLVI